MADEDEVWYAGLVGDTAYEKLVDFRNKHLKRIRICSRSKRWWDRELTTQVRRVGRERRMVRQVGHRNGLRSEISRIKQLVREKEDRCCKGFC